MEFFSKFADMFSGPKPVEQKQEASPAPSPMKQDLDGVIKALMASKPKEDDKKILLDSKIKEIKLQCLMNKLRNDG